MADNDYYDRYIAALEQLNEKRRVLNMLKNIVVRTMMEAEEERDYTGTVEEVYHLVMEDDDGERNELCG